MAAYSSRLMLFKNGIEVSHINESEDCVICKDSFQAPEEYLITRIFAQLSGDSGVPLSSDAPPISPLVSSMCRFTIASYSHVAIKINACGHVFGGNCLDRWLREQQSCPMCRQELFPPTTIDDEISNLEVEIRLVSIIPDIVQIIMGHVPAEITSAFQQFKAQILQAQELLRVVRANEDDSRGQQHNDADALDGESEAENEQNGSEEDDPNEDDGQNENEMAGDAAVGDVENEIE